MSDLRGLLEDAMTKENPTLAFRAAVKVHLESEESRQETFDALQKLRGSVDEFQEDVILEILDFLEGWCRKDMKI